MDAHGRCHQSGRNAGIEAALGQGLDEGAHLVWGIQLGHHARGAHHEVQIGLDVQTCPIMALNEGVFHQFGNGLFGEWRPVDGMGKYLLTGFGSTHISGHLHRLIDDVGLAGVHVRGGEYAFGRGIAHFYRGHDVKWFAVKIKVVEGRATGNAGRGFGLKEATEVHGEWE